MRNKTYLTKALHHTGCAADKMSDMWKVKQKIQADKAPSREKKNACEMDSKSIIHVEIQLSWQAGCRMGSLLIAIQTVIEKKSLNRPVRHTEITAEALKHTKMITPSLDR